MRGICDSGDIIRATFVRCRPSLLLLSTVFLTQSHPQRAMSSLLKKHGAKGIFSH